MALRLNTHGLLRVAAAAALTLGALAGCGGAGGQREASARAPVAANEPPRTDDEGEVPSEVSAEDRSPAAVAQQDKQRTCVRAIEHVIALIEAAGGELSEEHREVALTEGAGECARDATRAELDCVLAAEALEDVRACDARGG